MYFPVTSRCSAADGIGDGNSQALGMSELTESRFAAPRAFQSTILKRLDKLRRC